MTKIMNVFTALFKCIICALVFGNLTQSQFIDHNNKCSQCIPVSQCPFYITLLEVKNRANLQRIREASCGFSGRTPKVCCPLEKIQESTTVLPTFSRAGASLLPNRCGVTSSLDRIVGGTDANIATFTWMVALGYIEKGLDVLEFMCGGSIINERYILTAAHCVDPDELLQTFDLTVIHLGDWNLKTDPDCENLQSGSHCIPAVVKRKPIDIIIHENYNTRGPFSDDIALIRMDEPVNFDTAFIQPICLPPAGIDVKNYVKGKPAVVAGWGLTESGNSSDILQQLVVPQVDTGACNKIYRSKLSGNQICFGGNSKQDSCNGDSGGPIFVPTDLGPPYTQIGIVSFGVSVCGIARYPAVYTSVTEYKIWIEEHLKP